MADQQQNDFRSSDLGSSLQSSRDNRLERWTDADKDGLVPSPPRSTSEQKNQSPRTSTPPVIPSPSSLHDTSRTISQTVEHNNEANVAPPSQDSPRPSNKSTYAKLAQQPSPNNSTNSTFSMFSRFGKQRREEKNLQQPLSANQSEDTKLTRQELRRSCSESEITAILVAPPFSTSERQDGSIDQVHSGAPRTIPEMPVVADQKVFSHDSSQQASLESGSVKARTHEQTSEQPDYSRAYGKLSSLWGARKTQTTAVDVMNVRDKHNKSQPPSRDRSTSRQRTPPRHDEPFERHRHVEIVNRERNKDVGLLNKTFRSGTSKAAEGLGKARNLFKSQKMSTPPTTYSNERYVPQIVNLPLVEQTRATRITKRLELCRDKTEFWMPALPWRCIDYLNSRGSETEGIYRVPGSQREIDFYRQKFDQEGDVNLFEEAGLYDVNVIASLFKWWLRDLQDEIFPISQQTYLCEKYSEVDKAPQELRDILSHLSPFQYYLLFAITCHLSLVHACAEKNKMTYQNLQICFQASLKLHSLCFYWLVVDWRHCWQGCATEEGALAEEYQILDLTLSPRPPVQLTVQGRRASQTISPSNAAPPVPNSPQQGPAYRQNTDPKVNESVPATVASEESLEL